MKFQLFKDAVGEYRVRIRAKNHEILMTSEGYSEKSSATELIKLLRTGVGDAIVEDLTL